MRRTTLTLIWVGLCLFWSSQAFGLGLGDIDVKSGLNQPLDAEIKVLSVNPDDIDKITVNLADEITFVSSGVDRVPLLDQLVFTVQRKPNGRVVIKVTTKQAIREPFLDFFIEVNWPTGRRFREYTLLLDPPVFAGRTTAPRQAPALKRKTKSISDMMSGTPSRTAERKRKAKSVSDLLASPPSRDPRRQDATSAADYGPIERDETLWKIADAMRRGDSYSVEQYMMALFDDNPTAFFGDNINNLKAGYVLRAPDAATIARLSHSQAARNARQHYKLWLESKRLRQVATSKGISTDAGLASRSDSSGPTSRTSSDASDAQLRLTSPEDGDKSAVSGGGSASLNDSDFATINAKVDESKEQGTELQSQVASLETQLESMERLVTLKDDALVNLQNSLGSDVEDGADLTATDQNANQTSVTPVPAKKLAKTDSEANDSDEQPWWMTLLSDPKILGMIFGGIIVAGLVGWMVVRRRRQAAAEDLELGYASKQEEISISQGDDIILDEASGGQKDVFSEDAFASMDDLSSGGGNALEGESEIDPIAEADVYLAYRRFQQAEDLIKDALKSEPERQDLQLKMLEIYFGAGNKEAFEAQAEALFALLGGQDNELWGKVSEMGLELCPDHPLFGSSDSPSTTASGDGAAFDMNFSEAGAETASQQFDAGGAEDEFTTMMDGADQDATLSVFDTGAANMDTAIDGVSTELLDNDLTMNDVELDLNNEMPTENEFGAIDFEEGLGHGEQTIAEFSGDADAALEAVNLGSELEDVNSSGDDFGLDFNLDSLDATQAEGDAAFASDTDQDATQSETAAAFNDAEDFLSGLDDLDSLESFDANDDDLQVGGDVAVAMESSTDTAIAAVLSPGSEIEEVFTGLEDSDLMLDGEELFTGADMVGTKLDLARAYIDMDDRDGARGILQEVMQEGSDDQKQEAQALMQKIG